MHSDLTDGQANWRNLPVFQGFIASQELLADEIEKQRQNKKANEFFRIAQELLEKHFDLWVNKHLFLALFGEVDTAQVVAQFLLGQEATGFATNGLSESKIHGRSISMAAFRDFLQTRVTMSKEEILASVHLAPCIRDLSLVADGGDMWATQDCPIRLKRMQEHYKNCFSALATNSHLAERDVKGANFCSLINRPEYLASAYGTARAGLVAPINRNARLIQNTQEKRNGNRYVQAGKVGERKRKNGDEYIENKNAHQVRNILGEVHAQEAIKFVAKRHKMISDACKSDTERNEWERLRNQVTDKKNQYSEARVKLKTDDFKTKFNRPRAPNKIQRRRGVEVTPYMLGKVPYGKLLKSRDWDNLKVELIHRNLSTEGTWTACKTRLIQHEGDNKNFSVLSNVTFEWY
jgi:hypothetical protein